jgi:predicted ATPase
VGKTSLALAAANELMEEYRDGAVFIDLGALTTDAMARAALAAGVGVGGDGRNVLTETIEALTDRSLLVVLDNCEHLIDAAGEIAEALFVGAPGAAILTTSREPLRAAGERVFRLDPLELPPTSDGLTTECARRYAAVRLFEERAVARLGDFVMSDDDAPVVCEICRRLDGIPLAIELASATIDVFGLRGLAGQLDSRFDVLNRGRRTALPRHQTLRATLDWSYRILPLEQQTILQRLSIFAGAFTLDAARAIARGGLVSEGPIVEGVAELAAKSLISVELSADEARYRLLESTRHYCLEHLRASDDFERVGEAYAQWCRAAVEAAESRWTPRTPGDWVARHGFLIDDVRGALTHCLALEARTGLACDLLSVAMPLFHRRSLILESLGYAERLLERLRAAGVADSRATMQVKAAHGLALWYSQGQGPDTRAAWSEAYDLACELDDTRHKLVGLWGLWTCALYGGDVPATRARAVDFSVLAADQTRADQIDADYMMGCALHSDGDTQGSRRYIENVLAASRQPILANGALRFGFSQGVVARTTYAKILWLEGFPDQAMASAEQAVAEADAMGHGLTICFALVDAAANTAMLRGEPGAARRSLTRYYEFNARNGLAARDKFAKGLEASILLAEGRVEEGVRLALLAFDPGNRQGARLPGLIGSMAETLARLGRVSEALAIVTHTLQGIARHPGQWTRPEALRSLAAITAMQGGRDSAREAAALLRQSMTLAKAHGALAWRLRTATTMANLWRDGLNRREAEDHLCSAYEAFTEGFATADMRAARAALIMLRDPSLAAREWSTTASPWTVVATRERNPRTSATRSQRLPGWPRPR